MHEVLVNRLGGLSLPRKSVVRLTDRPDMTSDVYRGRKTTMQCNAMPMQSSAKYCIGMFKDFGNIPNSKKRCPVFFREKTSSVFILNNLY